ncbi:hypothetical protein TruAng_004559 [Truncatella angustata]|nr:hypothetical protein TruAng_004559 [Truncatella angustata]
MSEPTDREAQDKANLTRIRDNQRRSRARRKEYLQDLEQRLRIYELQGVEASAEIQQAARRVLDENKKLRVLLNEQGVTDSQIESFLQASNTAVSYTPQGPTAAEESVIQALSRLLAPRHPSFDSCLEQQKQSRSGRYDFEHTSSKTELASCTAIDIRPNGNVERHTVSDLTGLHTSIADEPDLA